MTTYHVWLTGQQGPETIQADTVHEHEGCLLFVEWSDNPANPAGVAVRRALQATEWQRWAVAHDDADHII